MKATMPFLFLLLALVAAKADYLVTSRSANVKDQPASTGETLEHLEENMTAELLDAGIQVNGYYRVITQAGTEGWIYRTLVRRYAGPVTEGPSGATTNLSSLSFDATLPAAKSGDVVIPHDGYTSCLNTSFLLPNWVAHTVSDELLRGTAKRKGSTYPRDNAFPVLKGNAYALSGYDHGHLAPAGDFKRSQELMDESLYMTNMTPQHGCMNQKGWCVLESNVRNWARENPTSLFYVFSGPILTDFADTLCIDNATTVYVPSQFFKVVIEKTATGAVRSAAFLVANNNVEFADLSDGRVSVDHVESITGLNFMPTLTKAQETVIEKKYFAYELKNLPECNGGKSCEGIYSNRKRPEDRDKLICK